MLTANSPGLFLGVCAVNAEISFGVGFAPVAEFPAFLARFDICCFQASPPLNREQSPPPPLDR